MSHRPIPTLTADDADRFWSKVRMCGPAECWPWIGYLNQFGYGRINFGSRRGPRTRGRFLSNRIAYFLHHRSDPGDKSVCHHCDNPACCNPAHLFLGSHAENMHDRDRKRRQAHGERAGRAKLTTDQVVAIRHRKAAGETAREIANKYGLDRSVVSLIVRGKSWGHVAEGIDPKNTRTKLSDDQVRQARRLRASGKTKKEIANMFGVSYNAIRAIIAGRTWKHVT